MDRIFLVEDEISLNTLLVSYLVEAGYEVVSFTNGSEAAKRVDETPSIWVLDIMLPGIDGYTLLNMIKAKNSNIPVIFISARNAELDRVLGLEIGSDDYLPKPFLPRELVLRINRILNKRADSVLLDNQKIGEYNFDRKKRLICLNNSEIVLSVKEYDVLDYLLQNIGVAKSRTEILDSVWGTNYFGSDRVVDDTLRRIRKKCPGLKIENLYGFGYMLTTEK